MVCVSYGNILKELWVPLLALSRIARLCSSKSCMNTFCPTRVPLQEFCSVVVFSYRTHPDNQMRRVCVLLHCPFATLSHVLIWQMQYVVNSARHHYQQIYYRRLQWPIGVSVRVQSNLRQFSFEVISLEKKEATEKEEEKVLSIMFWWYQYVFIRVSLYFFFAYFFSLIKLLIHSFVFVVVAVFHLFLFFVFAACTNMRAVCAWWKTVRKSTYSCGTQFEKNQKSPHNGFCMQFFLHFCKWWSRGSEIGICNEINIYFGTMTFA